MCEVLKSDICKRCGGTGEILMVAMAEWSTPPAICPECLGTGIVQVDLFDGVDELTLGDISV